MSKDKIEIGIIDCKEISALIKLNYKIDLEGLSSFSFQYRTEDFIEKNGYPSLRNFIMHLKSEKDCLTNYLQHILIGDSSLFRDPDFWKELKSILISKKEAINVIFPNIVNAYELYTLVVIIKEFGLKNISLNATMLCSFFKQKILKTPINQNVFETSKEDYLRFNPKGNFEEYFKITNNGIFLQEELLKEVSFQTVKSVGEIIKGEFDVIIYRNNFLYYNSQKKDEGLAKFSLVMKQGGLLALGIKENMNGLISEGAFKVYNEKESLYLSL